MSGPTGARVGETNPLLRHHEVARGKCMWARHTRGMVYIFKTKQR